jgi:tetratricopeptide (TPR) repeat protein
MKYIFALPLLFYSTALFSQTPDSSAWYFQKGIEEKAAKRYHVASEYFDKAIHVNSNYTAAYIENGFVNKEMRRADVSKQNFKKAYELDPANDIVIKELAELYYSYRQFQDAIEFAQKCRTCDNKDWIIAMSYYEQEDYGRAEKLLLNLVTKDPYDAEAIYTLARTYLEMGSEEKAIQYYEKAVRFDQAKNKWLFEMGLLYYNTRQYKNAVVYFNKAADHGFVQSNDFNENLGFAYIYSGEFDKGEKLLNEIVARKPGNKEILRDIALAFYENKMYDKCLDYCQKLMEMDKNDGKALYQAGLCFQKKGQKEKGEQMCDKAIQMDPTLAGLRQKKTLM